jgi:ACS family tartrate transporter-like MFS transporter
MTSIQGTVTPSWRGEIGDSAYRKVTRHIIPALIIFYILAYIGRSNLSYAALTMNVDLGITDTAFGMIAGIFFIGYFIFEVPSNILLDKFGARIWIARILISWGIIIIGTGFVQNVTQLYIARFLLGVAEAGFFPGVILYLSRWYLGRDAAKSVAMFMLAIPFAYMIGAPISGVIVDHVHWLGLPSWRWIFFIEGIPSIIGGIVCLKILPDKIRQVSWLDETEKTWLETSLAKEAALKPVGGTKHFSKEAFFNRQVWILVIAYFAVEMGEYGLAFWTPSIIESLGSHLSATTVGLLTAATYVLGAITMLVWGRHSDATRERKWHNVIPLIACAVALSAIGLAAHTLWAVVFLALIIGSVYAAFGPFWSLQNYYLTGASASVGIAMVNSFGNLAGFLSPTVIGMARDRTGVEYAGFFVIAAFMVVAAILLAVNVNNARLRAQEDAAKKAASAELVS